MSSGGLRNRVFHVLEVEPDDRGFERAVNVFLLVLILSNVAAVVLETVPSVYKGYASTFKVFELVSVTIFTSEYLFRVWSAVENPRFSRPIVGRLRFVLTPMAMVDLCAILPAFLPLLLPVDLRFARVLRLFRLARCLKIARYSQAMQTLGAVLRSRREELGITAFVGLVLLLFSSSAMYFVEHETQPKVFSSIPASMWWAAVTLTTVGYGDIYPVTPVGRFFASAIGVMGIGLFALPAGIIASGFAEEVQKRRTARKCPHCGNDLG